MRLTAFWRANIGPLDEFWSLSPRETDAITEAFLQREDAASWRLGTIAAAIHNQHARKKRDLVDWRAFFEPMAEQNQKRKQGMTIEEIRERTLAHLAMQR